MRPLVLLHGIGVGPDYLRPLARELAPGHDVRVPQLPREPMPMERLADALVPLLPGAVVANSMGCQVAVELAIRRPELVPSLVLIGPTLDPSRRSLPRLVGGFVLDGLREPPSLWWLIARDYARMGPRRLAGTAHFARTHRIEQRLPLVEAPTLVLRGEHDGLVSRRWCEEAAALLPHGRFADVPGAHATHYTHPSIVAPKVEHHLRER
jgi:pimeloyl-ACP methyl ester carboxylesterase